MSQSGNTDFLRVSSVSSAAIFTDAFIDEDNAAANFHTPDPVLLSGTGDEISAVIYEIVVPSRSDLVDSNGDRLPEDVIFSKMDMRVRIDSAPGTDSQVRGYILTTAASLAGVDWNTADGSTAWYPDQYGETTGTGGDTVYEKMVHGDIVINQSANPSDDTYLTLNLTDLANQGVDFGKTFQIIIYASVAAGWGFHGTSHTADRDHCPHAKFYFIKPSPDAATITVTPDSLGLSGTLNITRPTSDKNLQKYHVCWDYSADVGHGDNRKTFEDTSVTKIPFSDFDDEQYLTGDPNYYDSLPMTLPYANYFRVLSEDLYNTTTNATLSNEVSPPVRPVIVGKFKSYNSAEAVDTAPAIAEEMTLRFNPLTTSIRVSEYAINFDVESSLVDTGATWATGATTWTDDDTQGAYTQLENSNPTLFTLGDMLRINGEFVMVVGFDSAHSYTTVQRGMMNTAAIAHTGLSTSTKIYKVNYDDFHFIKLTQPAPTISVKHKFSKASEDVHTSHVAIMVKDEYGWCSNPESLNGTTGVTVAESTPIAKLTASRTKVPYAKYGDKTAGLTLSLANSKAVGSNREIVQYAFSYRGYDPSTVATANALSNNNECFETGSKRVQLISTGQDDLSSSTWRIFGLASYSSDGTTKIPDTETASFSHYKYVSEQVTAANRGGANTSLVPVSTTNYWKNIECVVCEEVDEHDDGNRFLLMVHPDDLTRHLASQLNEGDNLLTGETAATVDDSSFYKAGDLVSMSSGGSAPFEIAFVESVDSGASSITLRRNYLLTTAQEIPDDGQIRLVETKEIKHTWVNKELRAVGNFTSANTATKYMWGGFAQVIATSLDFESGAIWDLNTQTSASSFNNDDWYANGFAIGDVVKLKSNTTANGTYAAPKYYKIMDIDQTGGSGDYDLLYIAPSTDMLSDEEKLYVETTYSTANGRTADVIRYDNARNPTMTCALYNYSAASNVYLGTTDSVVFEGFVADNDPTSFILNADTDTLTVKATDVHTLDLDALASSGDIAILDYKIGRTGGASATMPLGDRRYPIGSTNSRMGSITMNINVRILTQAGYRQIYSLVEGDRYDYVFLDNTQVDTPTTVYKSFRMKLSGGSLAKNTEMASQYTASLNMLILGEEIS